MAGGISGAIVAAPDVSNRTMGARKRATGHPPQEG
jgi:hypothetical protein